MSDQVIVSTPSYTVTHSRAEINGVTYFTKNIASILVNSVHVPETKKVENKAKPGKEKAVNMGCSGIVFAFIAASIFAVLLDESSMVFTALMSIVSIVIFSCLFVISTSFVTTVTVSEEAKTQYEVILDTNSGKVTAYTTFDQSEAYALREAIEKAASAA